MNEEPDASVIQLIVLMRIYDVLMALLTEQNVDMARDLLEEHQSGNIVGGNPFFNGRFLMDEGEPSN